MPFRYTAVSSRKIFSFHYEKYADKVKVIDNHETRGAIVGRGLAHSV